MHTRNHMIQNWSGACLLLHHNLDPATGPSLEHFGGGEGIMLTCWPVLACHRQYGSPCPCVAPQLIIMHAIESPGNNNSDKDEHSHEK